MGLTLIDLGKASWYVTGLTLLVILNGPTNLGASFHTVQFLAQTDRFESLDLNVSSTIWFCLCMFFFLSNP